MRKKEYTTIKMEYIIFDEDDVIRTSPIEGDRDDGTTNIFESGGNTTVVGGN